MTYALDTNIVSYLIQGQEGVLLMFRAALARGDSFAMPPVVYYEVRRGFLHRPAPAKEKALDRLCKMCQIGEMSIAAWECAARIYASGRRAGKVVEDSDILIAAYSVVQGYTLVTNNLRHFADVKGLRCVNWAT